MPFYYFSIENGEKILPDEGFWFPNDDAACRHAQQVSNDLSKSRKGDAVWLITVRDVKGNNIAVIPTRWVEL